MRRLDPSVARVAHQHAGMSQRVDVGAAQFLDVVAHPPERRDAARIEPVLDLHAERFRAPGAAVEQARRIYRVGHRHPVIGVAGEDLRLKLRLPVAAHGAVGHHPAVVEGGQRRDQGVERAPARLQRVHRARVERERHAAVLPADAGGGQHRAGAVLPVDRLDEGDRHAVAIDRPHPDGVALARAHREARRAAHVDQHRLAVEALRIEEGGRVALESVEIGDEAVADGEGALRRLDQPVVMGCGLRLADVQPIEDPEDDQRRDSLGGRREVVERGIAPPQGQGRPLLGRIGFEVGAGHRRAEPLQVGGDLAGDVAAVEVVEPRMDELGQGIGELGLRPDRPRRVGLALVQVGRREVRRVVQRVEFLRHVARLRRRDRAALAGVADRIRQDRVEGQPTAEGTGHVEGEAPAADRSGDRHRGIRAAGGDRVEPLLPVSRPRGEGSSRPAGLDAAHPAVALADQPEAVPADAVHVRVDHRDGRGHGHHRLDRVAALRQHILPGRGRQGMGGGDGRMGEDGRVGHVGTLTKPEIGKAGTRGRIRTMRGRAGQPSRSTFRCRSGIRRPRVG